MWRVALGFLLAPAVPAAIASATTLFDGHDNGSWFRTWLLYVWAGGFLPALFLAFPTWLALESRIAVTYRRAMFAGALVATLPWLLIALVAGNPDTASVGGAVTVQNGVRTLPGWLDAGRWLLIVASLGALGGVVFRVTVYGWRR